MSSQDKHIHNNLYRIPTSNSGGRTSKYEIIAALTTYLERSNTQYAVMIDGDWGTGKTYFYSTEIKPLVKLYPAIYISLYGLNSIRDIEDEIFKAISLHIGDSKSNYKGILSLYPEMVEDVKIGGSGYAVQFLINQWKEHSQSYFAPFLLCLDDFERWEGSYSTCLSYINKLVEHENAKCILIGNLSALEQGGHKGFEAAKDKTIGHVYKLENKTTTVFSAALSQINYKNIKSSDFIEKMINEKQSQLSIILNKSRHRNIRTVVEAIQLYEYIFNQNSAALISSKNLAFNYFCSLLATLILFKKYFITPEIRDKLLNGYNSSNQGYAFLDELGYFNEGEVEHITTESKFLLETIFFRGDKISLSGLFKIVNKGFYFEKDFIGDFDKWDAESAYESYLDSSSLLRLRDTDVLKIIKNVLQSIFDKKEITNPATLLLLAEHLTSDIKQGIIDLDPQQIKIQFIQLFEEIYREGLIDKNITYDLNFGDHYFQNCSDIYQIVLDLNKKYLKGIDDHNLSNFWLGINKDPTDVIKRFEKFKYEPIFSIYYNPQEVVDALKQLTNSQLSELVNWINSRNHNPEFIKVRTQEVEQAKNIAENITYSFKNKFGMQAGHMRKIAKLLIYS